jgi:hypothetical protein
VTLTRRRLLLAAVAAIFAAALAEISLRLLLDGDGLLLGHPLPPYGAVNHPHQRQWLEQRRGGRSLPGQFIHFDAELGWDLAADGQGGQGHLRCSTNSLGARGPREYAKRPAEGVLRIVCFGDSFTFGNEVGDADAWPARVEALDPAVEAINFGVGGYGVDQALLRFRRRGRDAGAQVVLVGIMLENICRHVNRYRPIYYASSPLVYGKPRFVLDGNGLRLLPQPFATEAALAQAMDDGSLVEAVRDGEYWIEDGVLNWLCTARVAAAWFARERRQWRALWEDTGGEPFRVTMALLEAFHREALAAGARLAPVLVFPSEKDLATLVDGEPPYWSTLTSGLQQRGIACIDLWVPLRVALQGRPVGALFSGGHYTAEGNDVVAREVLAWLRRQ